MPKFAVVHYCSDSFIGERFAVGAYVDTGKGGVWTVPMTRLPGADHLGLLEHNMLADIVKRHFSVRELDMTEIPDAGYVGPGFATGPVRDIPAGVQDPVSWVRALLGTTRVLKVGSCWRYLKTGEKFVINTVEDEHTSDPTAVMIRSTSGDGRARVKFSEIYAFFDHWDDRLPGTATEPVSVA